MDFQLNQTKESLLISITTACGIRELGHGQCVWNKVVLIDFYADWCGPCKMMSPVIDEIANEVSDKELITKIYK